MGGQGRGDRTWRRALVTGASSGIGASFARLLARRGVDLVLVARDRERLADLAGELELSGVDVECVPADLSSPVSRAAVEKLLVKGDPPIDLLVNNAGFGSSGNFADLPIAQEEQQVQLNVLAVMRLASAVLPGMLERGRGTILNVASVVGLYPAPGTATYAATKAFVCSFSDALHEEVRGTGVSVTASLPGPTRTEFHLRSGSTVHIPRFAWLNADDVAKQSLEAAEAGRSRVVPGTLYRAAVAALGPVPPGPRRWLVGRASLRHRSR